MGRYEKRGNRIVYVQENGEPTACFEGFEEKSILSHEGSARYKRAFYLLVLVGILYLGSVFLLY